MVQKEQSETLEDQFALGVDVPSVALPELDQRNGISVETDSPPVVVFDDWFDRIHPPDHMGGFELHTERGQGAQPTELPVGVHEKFDGVTFDLDLPSETTIEFPTDRVLVVVPGSLLRAGDKLYANEAMLIKREVLPNFRRALAYFELTQAELQPFQLPHD